jgi:hypothetical protein
MFGVVNVNEDDWLLECAPRPLCHQATAPNHELSSRLKPAKLSHMNDALCEACSRNKAVIELADSHMRSHSRWACRRAATVCPNVLRMCHAMLQSMGAMQVSLARLQTGQPMAYTRTTCIH